MVDGPGLSGGIVNTLSNFTIQARDKYGNDIHTGGNLGKIGAILGGPDGSSQQRVIHLTDLFNGQYLASHIVSIAGKYDIREAVRTKSLGIFKAAIAPGPMAIEKCNITGGLVANKWQLAMKAGVVSHFTISSQDSNGNLRTRGGDSLHVNIFNNDSAISVNVLDLTTGNYYATVQQHRCWIQDLCSSVWQ